MSEPTNITMYFNGKPSEDSFKNFVHILMNLKIEDVEEEAKDKVVK